MQDNVQKQDTDLGVPPAVPADQSHEANSVDQPREAVVEGDPKTWYGLVYRLVRVTIENDENFRRVCVLIILIAFIVTVWLVAGLVHLSNIHVIPVGWLIWALGD